MDDPEPLYVTCKTCAFPQAWVSPARIYEVPLSQGYELKCPTCGAVKTYKAEFYMVAT